MADLKNVEGVHGLTPTQAGMLYESLAAEDPTLYFEQLRVDVSGNVDPDRLKSAWQRVIDRHESLRTMLVWEKVDQPVQVVRREVELPFEYLDWHGGHHDLDKLAQRQRQAGINLTKAPLMAVTLIQLGAEEFHLIWNYHHIVVDGWSAAVVLDEVLAAYDGLDETRTRAQFSDYLTWTAAKNSESGRAYWSELLAGLDAPTRLALGTQRSDSQPYIARKLRFVIPAATAQDILRVARELRITTNTLLQGACALTLAAYSNESDVAFGVTTSGRPADLAGIESGVGMFLKTLPCRLDIAEATPVSKWLLALQDQQLRADENAHVGLAEAIAGTGLSGARTPFDLVWIYENFPSRDVDRYSLSLSNRSVFEQTNYPITLMAGASEDDLAIVALYDGSILGDRMVEEFVEYLATVASQLASRPDAPVAAMNGTTPDAERSLIETAAGPLLKFDTDTLVHERFDAQAFRIPDDVALVWDRGTLTYSRLRLESNWLATELAAKGMGPGSCIGVRMHRSPQLVTALLAIAKCGAAYMPLDPNHPPELRNLMRGEANTEVVLTESDLAQLGTAEHPPAVQLSSLDPLLITFTSGSTGTPKGVPVHHRGVMNRLEWQWDEFGSEPTEVAALKTNFTFVDHLWELWGALLAGRQIVILDESTTDNLQSFIDRLAATGVTQLGLVPSLLDAMCEHTDLAEALPVLNTWTVSGETLPAALVARFRRQLPDALLVNLYGMSEASQDCTFHIVPAQPESTVPIGLPIANMATYVLSPTGHLCPEGVVGELCVSGLGVSTSYINRPDTSAERFIPNPFGEGVLYKTGDLAWRRPDGALELAGRADRQVKIRGVRIELGEIEAWLRGHKSVSEAAVVFSDGNLVAYVSGPSVVPEALRSDAAAGLAATMVPSRIVVVDDLPKTTSGKLDRGALPAVEPAEEAEVDIAGRSPELAKMIVLWSDLLQRQVGPDDDFFAIGGHSLLGLKLFSRIGREFGEEMSLAVLATASTPRAITAHLGRTGGSAQWRHLVALSTSESGRGLFCVHGAGGNVLNLKDLARQLEPNLQLVGIKASGADDGRPLPSSIEEICDAYIGEITKFQPRGPILLAGFSNGGFAAYEIARRLNEAGRLVEAVFLLDTFHPSCSPQPFGRANHLRHLRADPGGYAKKKLRDKLGGLKLLAASQYQVAARRWPEEVAESTIITRMVAIWADYEPVPIDERIVLLSAIDTHETWLHVGSDRQWPPHFGIEVVQVPGDHTNHVEEPNAPATAAAILKALQV
jgi:surfactin family lipopeptide synthetase C